MSSESLQERLVRYLDNSLAVEKSLATSLGDMAADVPDPSLKALFTEHKATTERQAAALEARIKALGGSPGTVKGFLAKASAMVGDLLHVPKDDLDKPTQYLIKAYAAENFELAMYRSMEVYATAVGDTETAQLARTHAGEEKQTADRVWALLGQTSVQPALAAGGKG